MMMSKHSRNAQRRFPPSHGSQYSLRASRAQATTGASRFLRAVLLSAALSFCAIAPGQARTGAPGHIVLTWMSVTNWLFEVGDTRIVTDGYITRIPPASFSGPSFATGVPSQPDELAIRRVLDALGESGHIDFILTGTVTLTTLLTPLCGPN
jgi:hypothetical protein